jgi:hypothetical protein
MAVSTDAIEQQASSPVYSGLKREDEKWVTERAYNNPKFVEDLVRTSSSRFPATRGLAPWRQSAKASSPSTITTPLPQPLFSLAPGKDSSPASEAAGGRAVASVAAAADSFGG